jgi:hypothetical protein
MSKNPTVAVEKREVGRPQNASTEIAEQWPEEGDGSNVSLNETFEGGANVACLATFEPLPVLEEHLKEELTQYKLLEKEAAWRGIRIGILILKARQELKHGQFLPWLRGNVPFNRVHAWRFSRAAEVFLDRSRLGLTEAYNDLAVKQLSGPAKSATGMVKKTDARAVQLAFAFIGDRSFEDLCRELGMPSSGRKAPNPDRIAKTPEELRELKAMMARNDWAQINRLLSHWIHDKSFEHLSDLEIERARDSLKGALMLLPKLGK